MHKNTTVVFCWKLSFCYICACSFHSAFFTNLRNLFFRLTRHSKFKKHMKLLIFLWGHDIWCYLASENEDLEAENEDFILKDESVQHSFSSNLRTPILFFLYHSTFSTREGKKKKHIPHSKELSTHAFSILLFSFWKKMLWISKVFPKDLTPSWQ